MAKNTLVVGTVMIAVALAACGTNDVGTTCSVHTGEDGSRTLKCSDGLEVSLKDGVNGTSSLVTATPVDSAPGCPGSAVRIDSGLDSGAGDLAGNGVLDPSEVTSSRYVCNGATGATGSNGHGALVSVADGASSCANGGKTITVGVDTNDNGVLDASEVSATQVVCNGVDGAAATLATEAPGTNCPAGGVKIQVGTGAPAYVCHGSEGATGATGAAGDGAIVVAEPNGVNCTSGGVKLTVGAIGAPFYVCNGVDGASVTLTSEAPGVNCAAGGSKLQVGSGTPTHVCNGETAGATVEPAGSTCATGGIRFQAGTNPPAFVCNGAVGATGATGSTGSTGATGSVGATGATGGSCTIATTNFVTRLSCNDGSSYVLETKYGVGGTVSGSLGSLVLKNNGGDALTLTTSGAYTFATGIANTASYAVSIFSAPATQTCSLSNASGTVASAAVSNVNVTCACSAGLTNCDGVASNGCEVNTGTDAANCGTCGNACGAGTTCADGICSAIYYVSTTGSDSNAGTTTAAPFATPNAALAAVAALPSTTNVQIRVADGSYTASARLSLGVRTWLRGGYSSDFSTWTPSSGNTVLNSGAVTTPFVQFANGATTTSGLTGVTLTIPSPSNYWAIQAAGSPTVSYVKCTMTGAGGNMCFVHRSSGNPVVTDSTFRLDNDGIGVWFDGMGNGQFLRNDIRILAPYGNYVSAMRVEIPGAGNTTTISNSIIDVGLSDGYFSNVGIGLRGVFATGSIVITNNTIRFGSSSSTGSAIGPLGGNSSANTDISALRLTVENNILWSVRAAASSTTNKCIMHGPTPTLVSIKNNLMYGCGSEFTTGAATMSAVNAQANFVGNDSQNAFGSNAYFVNAGGSSSGTVTTGDWHLVAGSDAIATFLTRGGLDRGGVALARDGVTRTGNGTTGWSLGAYEQNN